MRKSACFVVFVILITSPVSAWAQLLTHRIDSWYLQETGGGQPQHLNYRWEKRQVFLGLNNNRAAKELNQGQRFKSDAPSALENWTNYSIDENTELKFGGNKLNANYETKFEPFCNNCKLQLQSTVWGDGDVRIEFKSPWQ